MGNKKWQDEKIFFAKPRRNLIYLEFQFLTLGTRLINVMLNLSNVPGFGGGSIYSRGLGENANFLLKVMKS